MPWFALVPEWTTTIGHEHQCLKRNAIDLKLRIPYFEIRSTAAGFLAPRAAQQTDDDALSGRPNDIALTTHGTLSAQDARQS